MDQAHRVELIRIAREAITRELSGVAVPCGSSFDLQISVGGAFVTLRNADRLRGCMGTFSPKPTLPETIEVVARLACRDPRFTHDPVTLDELPDITLELSLLSPLTETKDPAALRVGTHGILIRRQEASGCFLPRVATDYGWNAEEFLDRCCTSKAGLPVGAWKEPDTHVYLFTAEVIEE